MISILDPQWLLTLLRLLPFWLGMLMFVGVIVRFMVYG